MEQDRLFYDRESGRYNFYYKDEDGDIRDYGGIHCGEVFEFCFNDVCSGQGGDGGGVVSGRAAGSKAGRFKSQMQVRRGMLCM